jgi:hypothetical protein
MLYKNLLNSFCANMHFTVACNMGFVKLIDMSDIIGGSRKDLSKTRHGDIGPAKTAYHWYGTMFAFSTVEIVVVHG